jgi:CheY-like chemotaxis protein
MNKPTPTIMVVDDEPLLRSALAEALHNHGCRALTAANAPEALEIMKNGDSIDAALIDVQMPGGIDGFALAQWFAKHAPAVRIMLISGGVPAAKMRALLPSVRFMPKPVSLSAVVQALAAPNVAAAAQP